MASNWNATVRTLAAKNGPGTLAGIALSAEQNAMWTLLQHQEDAVIAVQAGDAVWNLTWAGGDCVRIINGTARKTIIGDGVIAKLLSQMQLAG